MRIEPISGSPGLTSGVYSTGVAIGGEKGISKEITQDSESSLVTVEGQSVSSKNQEEIDAAIRSIERVASEENISVKFSRDEETGQMVIQMIDQKSGEAIRQFPSEVQLKLAEVLGKLQGNIFNIKA